MRSFSRLMIENLSCTISLNATGGVTPGQICLKYDLTPGGRGGNLVA